MLVWGLKLYEIVSRQPCPMETGRTIVCPEAHMAHTVNLGIDFYREKKWSTRENNLIILTVYIKIYPITHTQLENKLTNWTSKIIFRWPKDDLSPITLGSISSFQLSFFEQSIPQTVFSLLCFAFCLEFLRAQVHSLPHPASVDHYFSTEELS